MAQEAILSAVKLSLIGCLPEICAALNRNFLNVVLLTAETARLGAKDSVVQALSVDPITNAARLSLKEIKDLADQMFEAEIIVIHPKGAHMDTTQTQRPNAIWIFGDQHRAQALSCNGDVNLHTPNLDRMAAVGLNCTSAVAGFPLCCPFRGSLLSSQYPHNCVPGHEYPMATETKTIAHAFKEHDYHTAYFGKWHVDGWKEHDGRSAMHIVPPERRGGFDVWAGYDNNNSQWDSWVHGGEGDDAFHYRLPGYETDCLTDLLIDYIRQQARQRDQGTGQPFFAALSVQPPHNQYVSPEKWMARHNPASVQLRPNVPPIERIQQQARQDLAGYYACIENLDWNVGRVRQALIDADLLDDTHIIFFSDHGDLHGSHGQFKKTAPWEESIRIPFIIGGRRDQYDGKGGICNAPINHVDIAPTTLGLCGIEPPSWMTGTDYSGYRIHNHEIQNEPESAYLQNVIPTMHGDSVDQPYRGVVTTDSWKYITFNNQPWLLFNLNEDPYELANLAHNIKYKAERKRLNDLVADWINRTNDTFDVAEL